MIQTIGNFSKQKDCFLKVKRCRNIETALGLTEEKQNKIRKDHLIKLLEKQQKQSEADQDYNADDI